MLAAADVGAALLASLSMVIAGNGEAAQLAWSLVFVPAWILVAKLLGLYDRDQRALRHLTVDEAPLLVVWALIGTSGLTVFLELTPAGRPVSSSGVIVGATAAVAVFLLRASARWLWRANTPPERVAIFGAADVAIAVRRKLELFPDVHMTIVAEYDAPMTNGKYSDLEWIETVDRIVLAPSTCDDSEVRPLLEIARAAGIKMSVVPACSGIFATTVHLDYLAELPVLAYSTADLSRSTLFLKRTMDVALSVLALIPLLPLFCCIAVAIKVDTRGPVFFSQLRAGRNGRSFRMRKFRTMVANAEELLGDVVLLDALEEPMFKIQSDPRATRVGRVLRRWSLDELPQLWNVLAGDMSLVGPRPEQIELVDRYAPEHRFRLSVKPGLTGPMQVYGRGELTFAERLAVERDYIENLSVGRDLRILGMTLAAVVRGKGAF
jgi:exopolysaccharide biosynthesis polyprenyl glycosylphosphotransferase